MTLNQAIDAMRMRIRVGAGEGEDYDEGRIEAITGHNTLCAMVSWDSGVRTPCPLDDLEVVA